MATRGAEAGLGGGLRLKQEEYEIYQEVEALRKTQNPVSWEVAGRGVQAREVRDLDFTVESLCKVRVVVAHGTMAGGSSPGRQKAPPSPGESLVMVGVTATGWLRHSDHLPDRPPALAH